jgi:acyl-CoA oxidase
VSIDSRALHEFIDGAHLQTRTQLLDLLGQERFRYVDTRDTAGYRQTVLEWCEELARHGFGALAYPAEFGGADDVGRSIAAFETLAYHDLSLLVKYGVQFGLFGGSVYLLGTRRHHERYLRAVGTLELPGCFAMTETDHGSNVRDIETVAAYDADRREFVVHTPHGGARKDYIGNAALHGRLAVVFAQLVSGTARHGVHAFLIPIRDEQGNVMPGVTIEDCGLKVGLNGVDNGRISFDQVRIPRENLLDRYGGITDGGQYTSSIESPGRRFFTMLGTLVAGRISIACASLSAARSGLAIAVRYTARRRQFGAQDGPEATLLSYTAMQRLLMPRLATAFAPDFALDDVVTAFAASTPGETRLRDDTDVFTTFEGANLVLLQLVARGRLTEYREAFGEFRPWNIARHVAARAATRVTELNPIVTRRTDPEHLLDPGFHLAALRYRDERLLASLARRLKRRLDDGRDAFEAFNECQDHAVELGRAFAERFVLERFHAALDRAPDALRPPARVAGRPLCPRPHRRRLRLVPGGGLPRIRQVAGGPDTDQCTIPLRGRRGAGAGRRVRDTGRAAGRADRDLSRPAQHNVNTAVALAVCGSPCWSETCGAAGTPRGAEWRHGRDEPVCSARRTLRRGR